MFLRNHWYVAAESGEVGSEPFARTILNEPVVLFRRRDGAPAALEDRCCHRRAPLSKGRVIGDALQCGYHGMTFDGDGTCVAVPGQSRIPPGARVRSYPLVERYGWIWLWPGAPERADAARVPDFHRKDDPSWTAVGMHMRVACGYLLMVDNLLDLSHVGFVHAATIGTEDSEARLTVERGDDRVRVVRRAAGLAPPPIYVAQGFEASIDQTKTMDFAPPANIWIDIASVESARPDGEGRGVHLNILNAITPETATSCHYFWASARDFDLDNEALTALTLKGTETAFLEDKDMLEAQQRCIDLDPTAPTVDLHGDAGGLQARRIVDRLLAEERAALAAE